MCEALDDHEGNVSIEGRLITNFRFADDCALNAEEEDEDAVLVDRLDTTTTRYKMEIGQYKTQVMTNNPKGYKLMSDRQYALRKRHTCSCETQLSTIINVWAKILDNKGQVDIYSYWILKKHLIHSRMNSLKANCLAMELVARH